MTQIFLWVFWKHKRKAHLCGDGGMPVSPSLFLNETKLRYRHWRSPPILETRMKRLSSVWPRCPDPYIYFSLLSFVISLLIFRENVAIYPPDILYVWIRWTILSRSPDPPISERDRGACHLSPASVQCSVFLYFVFGRVVASFAKAMSACGATFEGRRQKTESSGNGNFSYKCISVFSSG